MKIISKLDLGKSFWCAACESTGKKLPNPPICTNSWLKAKEHVYWPAVNLRIF